MTLFQAVILGLIQGLTEFLPVSSSGHLALAQSLMPGFEQPGLLYDTLLHLATLFAVVAYFRKRIGRMFQAAAGVFSQRYLIRSYEEKPMMVGIVIATIPTGIIGFLLRDHVEYFFDKPVIIGYFLIMTSVMLYISDKFRGRDNISPVSAFIVGVAQGLAVFPGISRSGTTIFAGLLSGLSREQAAEFSFLISIPAILGAVLLQIPNLEHLTLDGLWVYAAGMLVAFLSGLFAIGIMMRVVKKAKMSFFAVYCLIVGVSAILWM